MFLKSLEIFGFKSFADRTRIEFADGITALLGPNGCGKSNVVDAIKWVIGEQGAKALRAEKMENVIFAGTENRKPLNVAEVTLTILDEKGLLNLGLAEIAIKRRLYRSGESEYFINGKQAKLKDLRELFWDTGVGKAAYSVMEQGKIDQILSSRPEDRRYLFEEAAGITRSKARRAEAERNLEYTEQNMQKSELELAGVKKEYDTLKKQAEEAERFRALKTEEFEAELDLSLLRLKSLIQERDRRAASLEESRKRREELKEEIDEIAASLQENVSRMNDMQKRLADHTAEALKLQASKNSKMEISRHLAARKTELKTQVSQLEARLSGINERIASLEDDASEQDAAARSLASQLNDTENNIASFEDAVKAASGRVTVNDAEARRLEKEIAELENRRSECGEELQSITEDIVSELDARLKDAGYSSAAHKRAEEEVAQIVARIKALVASKKSLLADFARSPSADSLSRLSAAANDSLAEVEAQLSQLDGALENLKKASPAFLDEFLSPEGIITKKRAIDSEILQNRKACEQKRKMIAELRGESVDLSKKIEGYRATLQELRLSRVKMEEQVSSAEEKARLIRRELASQEGQLRQLENEIYTSQKSLEDVNSQIEDLDSELAEIEHKGAALAEQIVSLTCEIEAGTSDVSGRQGKLKELNDALAAEQARMEKLNMDASLSENDINHVRENFRERYSRDLAEFEQRMAALKAHSSQLREKRDAAREGLKKLGGVNFQAPELFEDAKERYEFLSGQLEDLKKAREDLVLITEEIRAEAAEHFMDAYNKIKKNFHNTFRRLFGGGRAELRLVDPQNVLECGIEIFAQPPGKRLENISLLSGGEKSMTAVALLFATYMVKPSPFCLLDEIDAALDDQNVSRFVAMLHEFADASQYIVITHNKKTAVSAGTALGITMQESGVSQLISIKYTDFVDYSADSLQEGDADFEDEDVPLDEPVVLPARPERFARRSEAQAIQQEAEDIADISRGEGE